MDGVLVGGLRDTPFDSRPWAEGGREIWAALGERTCLLSMVPDVKLARSYWEKRAWVDCHLGAHIALLVVPDSLGKAGYCRVGDVLVDDVKSNCDAWERAGGLVVWHQGDLDWTLASIRAC